MYLLRESDMLVVGFFIVLGLTLLGTYLILISNNRSLKKRKEHERERKRRWARRHARDFRR